jgi:hypothetical protein|nr:MAG TPA: hypothetical protein [Caudoviricetes sp.]
MSTLGITNAVKFNTIELYHYVLVITSYEVRVSCC